MVADSQNNSTPSRLKNNHGTKTEEMGEVAVCIDADTAAGGPGSGTAMFD